MSSLFLPEPVSYVNAPQLAAERGLEVRETSTVTAHDFVNLITLRGGGHSVAGTLAGPRSEPRLVMLDDHTVEVPPAPHMVVVRNDDSPGMIGVVVGTHGDGYGGLLGWMWVVCAITTGVLFLVTWLALRERFYSAVMAATGLLYLAILTAFGTDLVARALLAP